MNNIKVGTRLIAAFLFLASLTAILGIWLEQDLEKMYERDVVLYEQGVVPLGLLVLTAEMAQELRVQAREWRLAKNPAERAAAIREMEEARRELKAAVDRQIELAITENGKRQLRDLRESADKYVSEFHAHVKVSDGFCPSSGMNWDDFPQPLLDATSEVMKLKKEAVDAKIAASEEISMENKAIADQSTMVAIVGIILAVLISIGAGIYLTKSITNPLKVVVDALSKMEQGDITVRANLVREDELGVLAKALDSFATKLGGIIKGLHVDADALASASEELSAVSRQLASGAEESVSQSNTVASTSEQMAVNINAMASGAEQASVNANEVAGAAEQMSTNMNTIAAAIEEMSASISEIASNAGEARKVAGDATVKSQDATTVMGKLGTAAKEIGQVTDVIKKIADKTNLLALNATIEAASAGEAGKGFAVVAGEIKDLANQSAQSADDISRRIDGIQGETGNAVTVIQDVSEIITRINHSIESIANHVDQQTKASNEIASNVAQANLGAKRVAGAIGEVAKGGHDIARNAAEAAKGASDVSVNVGGINQVAKDSASGATQVYQSSSELSKIASALKNTVSQFKV
ncbi:MAG: methyl-accepting chemotaxis protein [Fibromonadaceae bacterium]|jgi:methyl-accepting chemotaxis protein|nr:methyl-accepting chemotaxis protein [Fibromonadaceae bacterium]